MNRTAVLYLLACTVSCSSASLLLGAFTSFGNPHWPYSLLQYVTFLLILILIKSGQHRARSGTENTFGFIMIKMLVLITGIYVYSQLSGDTLLTFSIHFMIHYVLFTAIEIRYLLSINRRSS